MFLRAGRHCCSLLTVHTRPFLLPPAPTLPQHFHYSYLINVAAVLAHLQPGWLDDAKEEWVNTLVRDVNSPDKVTSDTKLFSMYVAWS